MSIQLETLPPAEIGRRLRVARENAGISVALAANLLKVPVAGINDVERGRYQLNPRELSMAAKAYQVPLGMLMEPGGVILRLAPQFRKLVKEADDRQMSHATRVLNQLVSAELGLERILDRRMEFDYPPEHNIVETNTDRQAEQIAYRLRRKLKLGDDPVPDIIPLLERLHIRVYVRPIASHISGLYSYHEEAGACVLLNAAHPQERRRQTAAHELGHFMITRRRSQICDRDLAQRCKSERVASVFGRSFLTPAAIVRKRFQALSYNADSLSRRLVIQLALEFRVSREAMVKRLEELELVRSGSWEWFQENGGITHEHVKEVLKSQDCAPQERYGLDCLPPRVKPLVRAALSGQIYSEGQLCQLFLINRWELQDMLNKWADEDDQPDESATFIDR